MSLLTATHSPKEMVRGVPACVRAMEKRNVLRQLVVVRAARARAHAKREEKVRARGRKEGRKEGNKESNHYGTHMIHVKIGALS